MVQTVQTVRKAFREKLELRGHRGPLVRLDRKVQPVLREIPELLGRKGYREKLELLEPMAQTEQTARKAFRVRQELQEPMAQTVRRD